jgi:hypothetical protein
LTATKHLRRFGSSECRIDVQREGAAVYTARLFIVNQDGTTPILDAAGQPIVLIANSPA